MDQNDQMPMDDGEIPPGNAQNMDYSGVVVNRSMLQSIMERNASIMQQSSNAYYQAQEMYNWAADALQQFDAANHARAIIQEEAAQVVANAEPVAAAPPAAPVLAEPALHAPLASGAVEVAKAKEEPVDVDEDVGEEPGNDATNPTVTEPRRSRRLIEKKLKKQQ